MFFPVIPKKIYVAYLAFFVLNVIFVSAFHDVAICLFAFLFSWWVLSGSQKVVHIEGDYISSSSVLFDFLIKVFSKKIYISDIKEILVRIDSFRFNTWKQIALIDKDGKRINFTMNMYEPAVLQQIFSYLASKNPNIIFDQAAGEIADLGTTQKAEEMHESRDFRFGLGLLIIILLVVMYYIWKWAWKI